MNAVLANRVTTYEPMLRPLERKLVNHMLKRGHITAREAMMDYGITSASLTRRMCDLEELGFRIERERAVHPITGQKYTRYKIAHC